MKELYVHIDFDVSKHSIINACIEELDWTQWLHDMQTIKVAVLRGDMLGLYLKTFQKMKPSINGYFLVDQMMIYRSNDRKTWLESEMSR